MTSQLSYVMAACWQYDVHANHDWMPRDSTVTSLGRFKTELMSQFLEMDHRALYMIHYIIKRVKGCEILLLK